MKLRVALCAFWLCTLPTLVSAEEHEGGRFKLGLDLVIGPGQKFAVEPLTTDALEVNAKLPTTESFLLGAGFEVADHFWLGARFGLSLGSVAKLGDGSEMVSAFSNLELEGEYELELGESTELAVGLGIALPTAQGAEPDEGASINDAADALRQRLVQTSAAAARGYEENALFEPGRLGFIPKVQLIHHMGSLVLEPYLKLESLIRLGSGTEKKVLTELVVGGFAGYQVLGVLTLGVRMWGNLALHETDESAYIVEPHVRVDLGPLRAAVGVIIPIATPLEEPAIAGIRLAASARF
jgi:hypothetical protein